jgi:hypothetical protein
LNALQVVLKLKLIKERDDWAIAAAEIAVTGASRAGEKKERVNFIFTSGTGFSILINHSLFNQILPCVIHEIAPLLGIRVIL